jgi:hypothetical protein
MQNIKYFLFVLTMMILLYGCSKQETEATVEESKQPQAYTVNVTAPEPLPVPQKIDPKSETDWESRTNNKNMEIVQVLNILYPVAAYITAAFEQHGDKLSDLTVEEWEDTQNQLTRASELYEKCKAKLENKEFNKQLFLNLEETWQLFVKVGSAGVRTKKMIDQELGM